ncbi:hypothetical protein LQW54_006621 [Pestalotiopsis sp. IQ-011]
MARTPHTPRRSKRLRNWRRPTHSIASVQRQSLRVAIRQSLEQHQPVDAVAGSSGSSIDSRESSPPGASSSSEEGSSITDTESQKSPVQSPGQFNGIPDKKPGWYKIKRIVAQRLSYFLVEWEGMDPDTGLDWPLDFVYRTDVSGAALRAWHEIQNAGGLQRARCGTLIMEESQGSVDHEEAWQRSIRQACGKS